MSAIRRMDRRTARQHQSSPYLRQTASKKSSWSLSGFLSYLNPLRSRDSAPSDPQHADPENLPAEPNGHDSPAQTLSKKGHQLANDLTVHGRSNADSSDSTQQPAPLRALIEFTTPPKRLPNEQTPHSQSPAKNIETVKEFLAQRAGQTLHEVEVQGLVALLQQSTPEDEKHEPFRFSSTTPSTPARGNSPHSGYAIASSSTQDIAGHGDSRTPRKTLPKNPNGVYRWEGGGSARPRNRYRSPGFGQSRSTPTKLKLSSPPEPPRTDTKRRRVGEDAQGSTAQQIPAQSSFNESSTQRASAPSPTRVATQTSTSSFPFPVSNGNSSTVNGNSPSQPGMNGASSSQLRGPVLPSKPTAPAVPSPLRQAWGQSDSSPPNTLKQTKAASFMADLIKEVTPPMRPDVSNPYQTASPVKPAAKKTTVKRPRASGKPTVPTQKEKERKPEVESSPQAIIEATIPKGSKRSRPPSHLERSPPETNVLSVPPPVIVPRRSPRQRAADLPNVNIVNGVNGNAHRRRPSPIEVDELEDADTHSDLPKKHKTSPVNGFSGADSSYSPPPSIIIEEIDDVDMPLASNPLGPSEITEPVERSTNSKPSQPIASSFFSSTASAPQSANRQPFAPSLKSSTPKEPSKLRFSYQPERTSASLPPSSLPLPSAQREEQQQKTSSNPQDPALAIDLKSLPEYEFIFPESNSVAGPIHVKAREAAQALPESVLPTFDFSPSTCASSTPKPAAGFNWEAAGMKMPAKVAGETWTCGTCMLSNPATAVEKCTICEAPKPGAKAAPPVNGFNWTAAGLKAPSKTVGESWTCGTCMLSNPASALEKCTVCDASR